MIGDSQAETERAAALMRVDLGPNEAARSAGDRAHGALRAEISSGRIVPGTMLSENDLAREFGMSRTPVRQALARLQDEGWITIYPKRGALVRPITAEEGRQLADAIVLLESDGVARARPEALLALAPRLAGLATEHEAALARGDLEGFVELTLLFHRGFVEVGGNLVLLETYDRLRHRRAMLLLRDRAEILGRAVALVAEHRALVALAADGDAEGFRAALAEHVTSTHGELLRPEG